MHSNWAGKQPHRLPNINQNVITDVGPDEASSASRQNSKTLTSKAICRR